MVEPSATLVVALGTANIATLALAFLIFHYSRKERNSLIDRLMSKNLTEYKFSEHGIKRESKPKPPVVAALEALPGMGVNPFLYDTAFETSLANQQKELAETLGEH